MKGFPENTLAWRVVYAGTSTDAGGQSHAVVLPRHCPDINSRTRLEVFVAGNHDVAMLVLKADTVAIVDTVKALDGGYDGLGGVVCVHQYTERDACLDFSRVV